MARVLSPDNLGGGVDVGTGGVGVGVGDAPLPKYGAGTMVDAIPGPMEERPPVLGALLSAGEAWELVDGPQREERGRAFRPLVAAEEEVAALTSLCFLLCCLSSWPSASRRHGRRRSSKTIGMSVWCCC